MKKSITIFIILTLFSLGALVYAWYFLDSQIGQAKLTEETLEGDRDAADGLVVGFEAHSGNSMYWFNAFDYATDEMRSVFKRGERAEEEDASIYDSIRFTGWSTVPYSTQLEYEGLKGLQDKKIHTYYAGIQQKVMAKGSAANGEIKLKDYLDYYPISFRFKLGNKIYNSDNALIGLKVYDETGMLSSENAATYDDDVELYTMLNDTFKIPVIKNEYQKYRISKIKDYDEKTSLGYKTNIEKPLSTGKDFYEFDPVIVIQEENIKDGKTWEHPDLSGGLSYEANSNETDSTDGVETADEYNLKNRMLFALNNKTAKGADIDVSQISSGYGVYEIPLTVTATGSVTKSPKSSLLISPKIMTNEMKMVYPLDKKAECIEMSLSEDHRYLAIFSIKDGNYFVDMVDADNWSSKGDIKVFPASKKMSYSWGEDGCLALTNHEGYIAVISKTKQGYNPYQLLYSGKPENHLDDALFDSEMLVKKNSNTGYKYGIEKDLAVAIKDGKVALVQNLPVGNQEFSIRNAALECALIDKGGLLYRGILKSNIVDLKYDMNESEIRDIKELSGDSVFRKSLIKPVRYENRIRWKTQ